MIFNSYKRIPLLDNECWYGGCVSEGTNMPYTSSSDFTNSIVINKTNNQVVPLLVSSMGRYIWCDSGFVYTFKNGYVEIKAENCNIVFEENYNNLREVVLEVSRKYFKLSPKVPPELFFIVPQYNTWIELLYNQNQQQIIDYAKKIIDNGLPAGILMIDCGWAEYNGCMKFHSGKFPNPFKMVNFLHDLGFKVMLWESPFISADTIVYRELASKGYLVMNKNGEPDIKKWWDGYSAVLDMSNPGTCKWLRNQNENLMNKYGIDGFKLDGGDAYFYDYGDVTYGNVSPNQQSELWADFGLYYDYNEYRACFKCSGQHLVQRLADKCHSWDNKGLASLIPNMLAQSVLGYPFGCPDMIGGGEYLNFTSNIHNLDQELIIRYAQCCSLMPMMQFSAAPWRILSEYNFKVCKEAAICHNAFGKYIYSLAKEYRLIGEPIVRYMEYCFPHQGFEKIIDQFMLGNQVLVAPVIEKKALNRKIIFPKGNWYDSKKNLIIGPCVKVIDVDINSIPYFIKDDSLKI